MADQQDPKRLMDNQPTAIRHMDDNRKLRAALDSATRALREIAELPMGTLTRARGIAAAALAEIEGRKK